MDSKKIRIIFMGTPEFAVESLKVLVENNYNVVAVVTQPDKPVGRHQDTVKPSPVKIYALEHEIPVLQPEKMKDETFLTQLRSFRADLQVVVAFRMLPEVVWSMPRLGTFNVHAALLPQYRGAAPINWAIINGETETGVTTFFLDKDIDTGRVIQQRTFPIPDDADVEYVYNGLMHLGASLALDTIQLIAKQLPKELESSFDFSAVLSSISIPQEVAAEKLKIAPKIFKETCEVSWSKVAQDVHNFVRGLSPYPGTWSRLCSETGDKKEALVMKIYKTSLTNKTTSAVPGQIIVEKNHLYVSTNDFLLEILDLQLTGKKRMEAKAFLNGFKTIKDYRFI